MTSLGLVVVGFDSDEVWPEFCESLARSTVIPGEVVVVENSPALPTTIPSLPELSITVTHRPDNPGYGTSANHGVSELRTAPDLIVICNPDIVWQADTLEKMVAELESQPNVGIVGPRLLNNDGSTYPSARAFPGIRIGIGHALLGDLWKNNPWTTWYLGTQEGSEPRIVDWLSGACLMIREETFTSIDGFDEGYFMFVEDVDLCFRAKKQGWRSLFCSKCGSHPLRGPLDWASDGRDGEGSPSEHAKVSLPPLCGTGLLAYSPGAPSGALAQRHSCAAPVLTAKNPTLAIKFIFEDRFRLLCLKRINPFPDLRERRGQHSDSQQTRVFSLTNPHGGNRDATGHLNNGQQ